MPNDNYYSNNDDDATAESSGANEGMEGSERSDESDTGMGETTLIPKSMFGDKDVEPGHTCCFKVVSVHENEVEVAYKADEQKEEDEETPESAFDTRFEGA